MKVPETSENKRQASKYHEQKDTNVLSYIDVVFVASKFVFFADWSCFFGDCIHK